MGLISAALESAKGVLSDQWKEYFYCDALPANVLAVKGQKRAAKNNKGADNIISSGSIITVADGQCMLIVEQGKIVEVCAEPGEFVYDASTEPSILSGGLNGANIKAVFSNVGKRFTFGGIAPKEQRVYYINTKEIMGNKYGTPSSVPFRVVDASKNIDIDVNIRCFGEYSYRISNPLLFYVNVCSNFSGQYTRDQIDSQLKSELLTNLGYAFGKLSGKGVRYSALPAHNLEIADELNELLSKKWREKRGIEIVEFGINNVKADEADEKMLKEIQAYSNANAAAAGLASAQMDAMRSAANNQNGAMMGFMGVNAAQGAGGFNAQALYQMGAQQQAAQPAPAAAPANGWKCSCGAVVTGKFCPECGAKKPENTGWTCSCGTVNKGRFCSECGAKKPEGLPKYKCDKCGWEPEDPTKPPKFCPECGDIFNENDII